MFAFAWTYACPQGLTLHARIYRAVYRYFNLPIEICPYGSEIPFPTNYRRSIMFISKASRVFRARNACAVLVLLLTLRLSEGRAIGTTTTSQAEALALAGDWTNLAIASGIALDTVPATAGNYLMAHALVRNNHNDKALCIFGEGLREYTRSNPTSIREWFSWTRGLSDKNPTNPFAAYFYADAAARSEDYDLALSKIALTIEQAPTEPLGWLLRGVVRHKVGDKDRALEDLYHAMILAPDLAAAHTAYGTWFVQESTAPEIALESFNRALSLEPGNLLAINGKACALYALGEWEAARALFQQVLESSTCLPIAFRNLLTSVADHIAFLDKMEAELSAAHPGTTKLSQVGALKLEIGALKAQNAITSLGTAFVGTMRDLGVQFDLSVENGPQGPSIAVGLSVKPNLDEAYSFMRNYSTGVLESNFSSISALEHRTKEIWQSDLPGGVTTDMRRAYVDTGAWPVSTPYFYIYDPSPKSVGK
jgi:tetratricopeptide (TPR) repeat protein